MVMRLEQLHKTGALEAFLPVLLLQQPGLAKNPPGAAGADGNDVLIKHHERQPPVPLKRPVDKLNGRDQEICKERDRKLEKAREQRRKKRLRAYGPISPKGEITRFPIPH